MGRMRESEFMDKLLAVHEEAFKLCSLALTTQPFLRLYTHRLEHTVREAMATAKSIVREHG